MPAPTGKQKARQLVDLARSGTPGQLRELLEGWNPVSLPLAADNAAKHAMSHARPEMLAVALDPAFRDPSRHIPQVDLAHQIHRLVAALEDWRAEGRGRHGSGFELNTDPRVARLPEMIQVLVAAGAPLESRPLVDRPHPLTRAADLDLVDLARCLLAHGLDPDGRFDAHDQDVIHPVAMARSHQMLGVLLAARPAPLALTPHILSQWDGHHEALLGAWLAHGGHWDMDLDMGPDHPPMSLAHYAFGTGFEPITTSARRASRPSLQRAMIACGFDMEASSPCGLTWRQLAMETADPVMRKWLALSALPSAPSRAKPGARL